MFDIVSLANIKDTISRAMFEPYSLFQPVKAAVLGFDARGRSLVPTRYAISATLSGITWASRYHATPRMLRLGV